MKNKKGITLISLIITIIILIILAAIGIYLALGNNGILNKAEQAKNETIKQTATETINLKITNIQISSYAENQELPNLQYLADKLCEDNEIQYVTLESKVVASLDKITVGKQESIYTKLKEYPYEFEINSSLQLASIDGVKIADNNNDQTVTLTQSQYDSILSRLTALENNSNNTTTNGNYSTEEQIIGTWVDGKPIYRKMVTMVAPNVSTDGTYVDNYQSLSSLGINNSEIIIKTYGIVPSINKCIPFNTDQLYVIPFVNNKGEYLYLRSSAKIYNGLSCNIFVEYTKTTDQATE